MKHRTDGHTETTISGDPRADWPEAFELVPSLEVGYVWHASKFTREVINGFCGSASSTTSRSSGTRGVPYSREPCTGFSTSRHGLSGRRTPRGTAHIGALAPQIANVRASRAFPVWATAGNSRPQRNGISSLLQRAGDKSAHRVPLPAIALIISVIVAPPLRRIIAIYSAFESATRLFAVWPGRGRSASPSGEAEGTFAQLDIFRSLIRVQSRPCETDNISCASFHQKHQR